MTEALLPTRQGTKNNPRIFNIDEGIGNSLFIHALAFNVIAGKQP